MRARRVFVCALVLFTASLCRAQIPDPLNAASAPQPGSDHNYIDVGTETVNPADGSLTFHLNVPTTLNDPSGLGPHCTGQNTEHKNVLTCEQAQAAAQLTATLKNSTQERAQQQNDHPVHEAGVVNQTTSPDANGNSGHVQIVYANAQDMGGKGGIGGKLSAGATDATANTGAGGLAKGQVNVQFLTANAGGKVGRIKFGYGASASVGARVIKIGSQNSFSVEG